MSRLLENIIRKFLFEQVVKGTIYPLEQNEKTESEDAGAVQGFKVVVDQEISDEEWEQYNPKIEKSDVNLGRHYQKNIVQLVNNFFNEKTVAGYNDVLDENHIVIMGNTPTGTESFSVMFWIFKLDKFFEFSTKKEEEKVTFQDKDVEDQEEADAIRPTRFSILQSKCLTYTEYLKRYTTTNTILAKINQGVQQDVIAVTKNRKDRIKTNRILKNVEAGNILWPKIVAEQTCYGLKWFKGDDYVKPYPKLVVAVDVDENNIVFKYTLYDYGEWVKWATSLEKDIRTDDATGEFKKQYIINSKDCSQNRNTLTKVKMINKDIRKLYADYNPKLFNYTSWYQKNAAAPQNKVDELKEERVQQYTDYINDIIKKWPSQNTSNNLTWPSLLDSAFKGNLQNLYKEYNRILREFNLVKRSSTDSSKFVFDDGVSGYLTPRGQIIHDTGVEYLENVRDSLNGYEWYTYKCDTDENGVKRFTYPLNDNTVNIINDRIMLTNNKSFKEYFELLEDKLRQANLGVQPPDIDPEYEIEPVTPPNIE